MITIGFKTIHGSGSTVLILVLGVVLCVGSATAASPSFDCGKVEAGSIEEMICKDDALAALDCKLSEVYAAASKKAVNEHPAALITWGYGSREMRCKIKR